MANNLIDILANLEGPDEAVDERIASLMGWSQQRKGDRIVWLHSNSGKVIAIPKFTSELDQALMLLEHIAPGRTSGVSWETGNGSVIVEGLPPFTASSPAIALCIAALTIKRSQLQGLASNGGNDSA